MRVMKKTRRTYTTVALIILMLLISGCGSKVSTSNPVKDPVKGDLPDVTLKLGSFAAEATPLHKSLIKLSEIVSEKTDGHFNIELYPNSILGTQRELIEGLELGSSDIVLAPATNMSTIFPKLNLFNLPFLFMDRDHVYAVTDGEIGQKVYKELEDKTGIKTLAMMDSGFRHIGNSVREIKTPEDVEGLKLRAIDAPINIEMLRALGANAIPMAYGELFTALQQKTVDGQDGPLANIYASRFYEVQPYLTLTDLYYAVIMLVISDNAWNKLPEDYQKILVDACKEIQTFERELLVEEEAMYLKAIKDYGVKVTILTPEQKQMFRDKEQDVWKKYEDIVGKDTIIDILALEKK